MPKLVEKYMQSSHVTTRALAFLRKELTYAKASKMESLVACDTEQDPLKASSYALLDVVSAMLMAHDTRRIRPNVTCAKCKLLINLALQEAELSGGYDGSN